MTPDQEWTRFVRIWRDTMRRLFFPTYSRTGRWCGCAEDCRDMADHFARTGLIP